MVWLYIFIVILCLIFFYIIYLKYTRYKQVNNGTYPAKITLDKYKRLNFSIPYNSNFPPRILFIFEENKEDFGKSTFAPIKCDNEETFYYYKDLFKTCGDVWNWENQQFERYRKSIEEYLKNHKKVED